MIKQLAEEAKAGGEDSARTKFARPSKPSTQDMQEQIDVKVETIFLNQIKALTAEEPPSEEESWSSDDSLEDLEKYLASDVPDFKKAGQQILTQALNKADKDEAERRAMESFVREASSQLRPIPTLETSNYISLDGEVLGNGLIKRKLAPEPGQKIYLKRTRKVSNLNSQFPNLGISL